MLLSSVSRNRLLYLKHWITNLFQNEVRFKVQRIVLHELYSDGFHTFGCGYVHEEWGDIIRDHGFLWCQPEVSNFIGEVLTILDVVWSPSKTGASVEMFCDIISYWVDSVTCDITVLFLPVRTSKTVEITSTVSFNLNKKTTKTWMTENRHSHRKESLSTEF